MKCYRTYDVNTGELNVKEDDGTSFIAVIFFLGFLLGAIVTLSLVSAVALILFR